MEKIKAEDIVRKLDAIAESAVFSTLRLSPEELLIYKPQSDVSKGSAGKWKFSLGPVINEKGYIEKVNGGFFVDIAPQVKSDGQFAKFDWNEKITAKLGLPDISAMLLALRLVRNGQPIPTNLRPLVKVDGKWTPIEDATQLQLIHKSNFKDEDKTTIIGWRFSDRGSLFNIKQKAGQRTISLTLTEEVQLEAYLKLALDAFLITGA